MAFNKKTITKGLLWLCALTLVLCISLLTLVGITVGTQTGRVWLSEYAIEYVNQKTDFNITLSQLRFPALGRISATRVHIQQNDSTLLNIQKFDLKWQPFALLNSKILIHNISAHTLIFNKPEKTSSSETTDKSIDFESIKLPELHLKRFNIKSVTLKGFSSKEYDDLAFSLSASVRKIQGMPLSADLSVATLVALSTELKMSLKSDGPDLVIVQGSLQEPAGGKVSTLLKLPPKQKISADFDLSIHNSAEFISLDVATLQFPLSDTDISLSGKINTSKNAKKIVIPQLSIDIDNTFHQVNGDLTDGKLNFDLTLDKLPLDPIHAWLPALEQGRLNAVVHLGGSPTDPKISGPISVKALYNKVAIKADFVGTIDKEYVDIKKLNANVADASIRSSGQIHLTNMQTKLSLSLINIQSTMLAQLGAPIPDNLFFTIGTAEARLKGDIKNPSGTLTFNSNGNYKNKAFTLDSELNKHLNTLSFKSLNLKHDKALSTTEGDINIKTLESKLKVRVNSLPLALLEVVDVKLPDGLQNTQVDAELDIEGKLKNPTVSGEVNLQGQYEDIPFVLGAQGQYRQDESQLTRFTVTALDEEVVSSHLHFKNKAIKANVRISNLPTKLLSALNIPIKQGKFSADLAFEGTMDEPSLNGAIHYDTELVGYNEDSEETLSPFSWDVGITTKDKTLFLRSKMSRNNLPPIEFEAKAPLQPYIDYVKTKNINGPAKPIPTIAGLSGTFELDALAFFIDPEIHRLKGTLSTNIDINGNVSDPNIQGLLELKQTRYENQLTGTLVDKINCQLKANKSLLTLNKCEANDGKNGSYEITGKVVLPINQSAGEIDINLDTQNASIIHRSDIESEASGNISLTGNFKSMLAQGKLDVTPLSAVFESSYSSGIPTIRVEDASTITTSTPLETVSAETPKIALDLTIIAEQQAHLRGRGLEVELAGKIKIIGDIKKPQYDGEFKTVRGSFEVFNKKFSIEQGQIFLANNAISIAITGLYKKDGQSVQVNLSGTNDKLDIHFSAIPAMPEDEIMAFLIFGKSIHTITAFQAIQLAYSVQALRGDGSGFDPISSTRKMLGVDTLSIESATTKDGESGVNVGIGKYLNEKVYLELERTPDRTEPWKGNLEIELSPSIHLNSSTGGSSGIKGAEITWERDY